MMTRVIPLAAALAFAVAPALADPVALATTEAAAECQARGGTLELGPYGMQRADLNEDGMADDWLISEMDAVCQPDGSSVGEGDVFRLHAVVGEAVVGSWRVRGLVIAEVAWGPDQGLQKMLLLRRPGDACGFAAEDDDLPCAEALVWVQGAFRSVAPPPAAD
jgi:hypothetical protein